MKKKGDPRQRLLWLTLFAVAMAFLEAAVVVYLRRIHYPADPLSLFPMVAWTLSDLLLEIGREIATLVMLMAVAALAVKDRARRGAAFLYLFGIWDIFYYVWLKVTLGWPVSWTEWDILFLVPWAWIAPWWTPVAVALLFVLWGGAVLGWEAEPRFTGSGIFGLAAGTALVLAAFLGPAWPLLGKDPTAMAGFVPGTFAWATYGTGLSFLAAGLLLTLRAGKKTGSALDY